MDTLFVKPRPGRMALHEAPPHAPILLSGETVPATPYYLRQRDLHGDTVDAEPGDPGPGAAFSDAVPDAITPDTGPTLSEGGIQPAAPPAAVEKRPAKAAGTKRNTKQED